MPIEPPHPNSIPVALAGAVVTTVGTAGEVTFWAVWSDGLVCWTQGLLTLIFGVWAVYFWWRYVRLRRDRNRHGGVSSPGE
ncbi:membrane protein implicated in regulation of membrane protease activity [Amycolatopsis bartoniae]|nr:membrane protein implicated in regulation of membrane protease activity [Amycolatopsis bartoniae]